MRIASTLLREASRAGSTGGRRETALALASSARGMALGATPIAWNKPLSAAVHGLATLTDIQRFKRNLAQLLPAAADWIRKAPITPANTPAAVAELVAAAKRAAIATPAPTLAIPAIVVKGEVAEARSKVANILGSDFAAKASDRFVYRAGLRIKMSPAADLATAPTALVLEFQEGRAALPDAPALPQREGGAAEMVALFTAGVRQRRIEELRARFYASVTTMRADLEKKLSQVAEVCWLNATMQVTSGPRGVAECAAEAAVERIGMPRLLERETNISVPAVGAPAFRGASHVDGTGILVAVIDGECDASHPALAGRIIHKRNFTKETWGVSDPHATTVAGILCSAHASFGGVCPAATVLNYKVFTTKPGVAGTDFGAALAIQAALEDGARVANLSWGLGLGSNGDSREARAVNRAWRLGMVLVKSAGNKGPTPATLTSPADAADVLVVGATDRKGKALESYSSRGPNGHHAGPDLLAPGGNPQTVLQGLLPGGLTGAAGWGTSFATPHVAGLVVLLLQQNPALRPDDVRNLLAGKCAALGTTPASGQGRGFVKL